MGSLQDISVVEAPLQEVSQQGNDVVDNLLSSKVARGSLLKTLRQLTVALEQPEEIVQRVVFFVRLLQQFAAGYADELFQPSTYMCARVAIDLKLFNIIADAPAQVTSKQLAAQTNADEQLLGMYPTFL